MMISVFTPTYNRIGLLKRLYKSLVSQSSQNFEWVLVDDASTDGTEAWVGEICNNSTFPIVYKKINHGGKHRAINAGVSLAKGEFMFFVDSDDYLPNNSIEIIVKWINQIGEQKKIAGIAGLRQTPNGEIVGESPSIPVGAYIECSNLERYRKHLQGDKAEIYKTEILKKYCFPEFENEFFLTERIVWDKIAADGYKLRWHNRPIYVCEYLEDGLTKGGANAHKGHIANMHGYAVYVKQIMEWCPWREGLAEFIEFNFCCVEKCMPFRLRAICLNISFFSYIIWWLGTLCFRAYDKIIRIANERI